MNRYPILTAIARAERPHSPLHGPARDDWYERRRAARALLSIANPEGTSHARPRPCS